MKNTVLLLSAGLLTFACTSKKEIIIKKWNVKSIEIAGQILEGEIVSGFYFEIKPDGKYLIKGMNDEVGTWTLSQNNDSLITTNEKNRKSSYFIKSLEQKNFSMVDNSVGEATVTNFIAE